MQIDELRNWLERPQSWWQEPINQLLLLLGGAGLVLPLMILAAVR